MVTLALTFACLLPFFLSFSLCFLLAGELVGLSHSRVFTALPLSSFVNSIYKDSFFFFIFKLLNFCVFSYIKSFKLHV